MLKPGLKRDRKPDLKPYPKFDLEPLRCGPAGAAWVRNELFERLYIIASTYGVGFSQRSV